MQPYTVTFNGYALQNSSFRTRTIQHTDIPSKIIQAEARARSDGLTIVNVKYSSRIVEVEGMLTQADRATLVAKIDEMKLNLNGVSGVLDIQYGNGTRRYYATVDKLDIPEDFYSISQVPYKVSFYCADPFGYATTSGNISSLSNTSLLMDTLITMSGTIDSEPSIQLNINSAVNFAMLTVSNENTGEAIIVSRPSGNFQNGDQLIIDSKRKLVYLNGSGIDYTGRFPTLKADTTQQRLRTALMADSANYDLIVQYSPRFL